MYVSISEEAEACGAGYNGSLKGDEGGAEGDDAQEDLLYYRYNIIGHPINLITLLKLEIRYDLRF
jgi:hypothetical protein